MEIKIRAKLKAYIFLIFLLFLAFLTIKYSGKVSDVVENPKDFEVYINKFGAVGILVFIGFQILQIVVAVIPGEFVQVAAGYIYGVIPGTLYIMIGLFIGTFIVFYVTRIFGLSAINLFVPKKIMNKYEFIHNNKKLEIVVFILFLLPGVPKDTVTYIVSLTKIKPLRFFIICLLARFPGIFGSVYIGSNLHEENYTVVICIFLTSVALFVLGICMKDRIMNFFELRGHKEKR